MVDSEAAVDLIETIIRLVVIRTISQTFIYGEPSGCMISPSCIPSIDFFTNLDPSRHIFLSLPHLYLCHGVRYIFSNPPDFSQGIS